MNFGKSGLSVRKSAALVEIKHQTEPLIGPGGVRMGHLAGNCGQPEKLSKGGESADHPRLFPS